MPQNQCEMMILFFQSWTTRRWNRHVIINFIFLTCILAQFLSNTRTVTQSRVQQKVVDGQA